MATSSAEQDDSNDISGESSDDSESDSSPPSPIFSSELPPSSVIYMGETIGVELDENTAAQLGHIAMNKLRYITLLAMQFSRHENSLGLRVSDFSKAEQALDCQTYGHASTFKEPEFISVGGVSVLDEGPEIDLIATALSKKVPETVRRQSDPTFHVHHPCYHDKLANEDWNEDDEDDDGFVPEAEFFDEEVQDDFDRNEEDSNSEISESEEEKNNLLNRNNENSVLEDKPSVEPQTQDSKPQESTCDVEQKLEKMEEETFKASVLRLESDEEDFDGNDLKINEDDLSNLVEDLLCSDEDSSSESDNDSYCQQQNMLAGEWVEYAEMFTRSFFQDPMLREPAATVDSDDDEEDYDEDEVVEEEEEDDDDDDEVVEEEDELEEDDMEENEMEKDEMEEEETEEDEIEEDEMEEDEMEEDEVEHDEVEHDEVEQDEVEQNEMEEDEVEEDEVEGDEVEGDEVEGEEVEGEEVEGEEVEGEEVEGEEVEGEEVEGEEVEGEEVEGEEMEGDEVEGDEVEGEEVEGEEVEGEEMEGDELEGDEVEEDESDGDEVEGDESEGDEMEGDEVEGNEVEGDEMEGDEIEGDEVEDEDEDEDGDEDEEDDDEEEDEDEETESEDDTPIHNSEVSDGFDDILDDIRKNGAYPVLGILCDFFRDYVQGDYLEVTTVGLKRMCSVINAFLLCPAIPTNHHLKYMKNTMIEILMYPPPCEVLQCFTHTYMQVLTRYDDLMTWTCIYVSEAFTRILDLPLGEINEALKVVLLGALYLANGLETHDLRVAHKFGWHNQVIVFCHKHHLVFAGESTPPSECDSYIEDCILTFFRNFLSKYRSSLPHDELRKIRDIIREIYGEKFTFHFCQDEDLFSCRPRPRRKRNGNENGTSSTDEETESEEYYVIRTGWWNNKRTKIAYKASMASIL